MSSRTGADWGSDDSVAEEDSDVRADSIGCMETSQSEPSKAADAVIKAVLKGAFHCCREDAGVALLWLASTKQKQSVLVCNTVLLKAALILFQLFYSGFTKNLFEMLS